MKARIISQAYPYIANRVLTDDTQDELREALRRLIFTSDGHIRWGRLESLLDEAKESSGFDVALALDKLVDYVISSDGEELLNDIADQIVQEADSLGHDTLIYVTKALGALAARDDRRVAKALESLMPILQGKNKSETDASSQLESGISNVLESIRSNIAETLPEPVSSNFICISCISCIAYQSFSILPSLLPCKELGR